MADMGASHSPMADRYQDKQWVQEFQKAAQTDFQAGLSEAELDAFATKVDVNGDGNIDEFEVRKTMLNMTTEANQQRAEITGAISEHDNSDRRGGYRTFDDVHYGELDSEVLPPPANRREQLVNAREYVTARIDHLGAVFDAELGKDMQVFDSQDHVSRFLMSNYDEVTTDQFKEILRGHKAE